MRTLLLLIFSTLFLSFTVNGQIIKKDGRIILKIVTPDKMTIPVRTDIRYAASYSTTSRKFLFDGDGLNFGPSSHSGPEVALIDGANSPYKIRPAGQLFEFTTDEHFQTSRLVKSVEFQGWDNKLYILRPIDLFGKTGLKSEVEHYERTKIKSRYPIRKSLQKSSKIDGKSWRFENIKVTLSANGNIDLKATQTTNHCEGFTGRIFLILRDAKGNALARINFDRQGVDSEFPCRGGSKGYNKFLKLDIISNPEIIIGCTSIEIHVERNGSGKTFEYYSGQLKKIAKDLEDAGTSAGKIIAVFGG